MRKDYRLYFMTAQGHIQSAQEVECASDDEAIDLAGSMADGRRMELWSLNRLVGEFSADGQEKRQRSNPAAAPWRKSVTSSDDGAASAGQGGWELPGAALDSRPPSNG